MKRSACFPLIALSLLLVPYSFADSTSYSGSLNTPEDVFTATFTLTSASAVNVQTFGFGGGTNAQGTIISSGGFDPLIALFSGAGASAAILIDGSGNPIFSSDNFAGFEGSCPPGNMDIGVCGDATLNLSSLAAGTYTLLLSDANYIPLPVDPGPAGGSTLLSDGFTDLTGGAFQTCVQDTSGNLDCFSRIGTTPWI